MIRAMQVLLRHGARDRINTADTCPVDRRQVHSRTALIQAASAGQFKACRALLQAGASFDEIDSNNQSALDYLFYRKHSKLRRDRQASAGYTCMQLYGLLQEFGMLALVTEELRQDCAGCGRCRFLLATLSESELFNDDDAEECATSSSSSESS